MDARQALIIVAAILAAGLVAARLGALVGIGSSFVVGAVAGVLAVTFVSAPTRRKRGDGTPRA